MTDKYTQKEICRTLLISESVIRKTLDRNNVKRRSTSECNRRYALNEHYFDEINTPSKAYILGLLYADGYHNVKDNTISITLQEEDKHILESINILINSNRPLRFINNNEKNPNWKNCYQLSFTSPYVSNVLEQFGLIGAKSLVLEFPEQLDRDLYSHFIRGFF